MPNNVVSNAGQVAVFNALSPNYADVSLGYAYSIILANQTNADVVAGDYSVETAPADPADLTGCTPGTFAPLDVMPDCDALPGAVSAPASITLSAQNPIKAHSQCQFSVACPEKFLRVVGPATGNTLDVMVAVTRLKGTAMAGIQVAA